jgi:hypothetical protein
MPGFGKLSYNTESKLLVKKKVCSDVRIGEKGAHAIIMTPTVKE